MRDVKIRDGLFFNAQSINNLFDSSEKFKWQRIYKLKNVSKGEVLFLTEIFLKEAPQPELDGVKKIGIIIEPIELHENNYEFINQIKDSVDYLLTYDTNFVDNKKILFYPLGGCWIEKQDRKIYDKTKLVSAIFSNKTQTSGHKFRNSVYTMFRNKVDFFGSIAQKIDKKVEGLKDYMYHIVVENGRQNDYFTEKIIDCFVTGTIPIYRGTANIGKYFNINGIYTFETEKELEEILKKISKEDYDSKKQSIQENFEKAKEYVLAEDWIFNKYPFLFEGK